MLRHNRSTFDVSELASTRRGYGIVEIIICMIMLGSLASWLIPILNTITTKRIELSERSRLQQVSMNIVERLSVVVYDNATFESRAADLIEAVKQNHATLSLTPGETNPQGLRRIDLIVTPEDTRKTIRPIKLTTWMREAAQ